MPKVPSVNPARLENSVTSKVKHAITVAKESIVKVKRVVVRMDL